MNPLLLMVELEYERVARICDNMFSYKKSTVLLLSGIPKIYKNCENTDRPTDRPTDQPDFLG